MAQYSVPQFIEAEGKIISFLTYRQFFILIGAAAICGLLYYTLPLPIFAISALMVAALAGAIAFLKIDNTSVVVLFLNVVTFSTASKNYVWKKKDSPYPYKIRAGARPSNVQTLNTLQKSQTNTLKNTKQIVELRKKK